VVKEMQTHYYFLAPAELGMENLGVTRYLNFLGFFLISKHFGMSLDCNFKQEDYFFQMQV